MRPFEALTLFFAALSLVPLLLRLPRFRWLPLGASLFMFLHLFLEGYRWQMLSAYLLVALLSLQSLLLLTRLSRPHTRPFLHLAVIFVTLLWLVLAAALPALLPVPQPLPPNGPYGVGTRSEYLVDESRPEIYSAQVQHRELMVQIWYPGQVGPQSERAPFIDRIDVAGPAIASRLDLPQFVLGHLNLVSTHAYLDVPVAPGGPYPLLIFSHGLRGIRVQNTSLMQHLASHGYIVVAIDHPYANVLTVFPDGRVVFYDDDAVMPDDLAVEAAGARLLEVWEQDIRFALQQVERWSQTQDHPLRGQVDASRLGLLGHSTGGGAAIQACATVGQCDAALALDGWIQPISESVRRQPFEPALMLINAPDWLGPGNRALGEHLYRQRQGEGYLLNVAGTVHFDYTDIPLMSPLTTLIGLSGQVGGRRMATLLNDYSRAFFDHILKDQPAPLLQGPSPTYPEVTFAR